MIRQVLGAAAAALLIVSDRLACAALAVALIVLVRVLAHTARPFAPAAHAAIPSRG